MIPVEAPELLQLCKQSDHFDYAEVTIPANTTWMARGALWYRQKCGVTFQNSARWSVGVYDITNGWAGVGGRASLHPPPASKDKAPNVPKPGGQQPPNKPKTKPKKAKKGKAPKPGKQPPAAAGAGAEKPVI